jgi:hypothetical protein
VNNLIMGSLLRVGSTTCQIRLCMNWHRFLDVSLFKLNSVRNCGKKMSRCDSCIEKIPRSNDRTNEARSLESEST